MNPCKQCELSFRHGGKDGAWMCRGVSPAEPADNFNHEACEAFRKQFKKQKIFAELYQNESVINHPDYYNWKGTECKKVIEIMTRGLSGEEAYYMGSIIKYLYRYPKKGTLLSDLAKAEEYTKFLRELFTK